MSAILSFFEKNKKISRSARQLSYFFNSIFEDLAKTVCEVGREDEHDASIVVHRAEVLERGTV